MNAFVFATMLVPMLQPPVSEELWGISPDGQAVHLYTLDNGRGLRAEISDYGATIVSLNTLDNKGVVADVALGFRTLDDYVAKSPYFGCVVGRYANRIAWGKFSLDGNTYRLFTNNAPAGMACHLHGGARGFDKKVWQAKSSVTGSGPSLSLEYMSKDGEEGYPGNLSVRVVYTVTTDSVLRVDYFATTDKATPINLSQHTYFNLQGEGNGDILGHRMQIDASQMTPVNKGLIPTGVISKTKGTPFDFTAPHTIGERIGSKDAQMVFGNGYDHNWVLDKGSKYGRAARVEEPTSGRIMEVWTDQPGLQFYCGNFLDGKLVGKSGKAYPFRSGFCLESQHYPDSPNHPSFPSTILLPGQSYKTRTEFRFGVK